MKALLLAFVLAALAHSQNPNLNIETTYDRFADVTTVALNESLIPSGVVNLGGGSVYVPPGAQRRSVTFHIVGSVKGKDPKAKAPSVSIAFTCISDDWRYLNLSTLRMILNEKERLLLGDMKRSGDVLKNGGVIEQLSLAVPFSTIERLSQASKIEMQIGLDEFEMKGSQISDIKDWTSRFPAAQSQPKAKP